MKSQLKKYYSILIFILAFVQVQGNNEVIVLDEGFDDNSLEWYEGENETTRCAVKDGHYYIQNKNGQSRWIYKELHQIIPNSEDFSISMKIRQTSGNGGLGFGMLFSLFKDKGAYKKFLISSSRQFKIDDYYNQKSHLQVDYTPHQNLLPGSEFNELKIIKKANTVIYFINGEEVYRSSNNSTYGSRMAFFMGGKMEIEIDDIKVVKTTSAINLVKNAHKIGDRTRLPVTINSPFDELSPILSADGKTMYVCRSKHPQNMGGNDIWSSKLDSKGVWGELELLASPLNNEGHNFVVSVAPDNNQLILANTYRKDGAPLGNGLSMTQKTKKGWSVPKTLEIDNFYNKDKFVAYFMCPDNKTLIISAKRNDSHGEKDLYVSFLKEDGGWSAPKNIGAVVNTFENEVNPFVAADNKTLYFASQGHAGYGKHDIFVVKRLDDTWLNWSEPQNLGPKINSPYNEFSFFLDAEGEQAYLGSGGDIWKIENPMKPDPAVLIKGFVWNEKTKSPMAVDIKYYDLNTGKELGIASSDPQTGAYQIVLPAGKTYSYHAEKNNFYAVSNYIDLEGVDHYVEDSIDLYLKPIEKGETVRLNNIFFEFDEAILKDASFAELNRLAGMLVKNQALQIEIGGHTDDKGSSEYNLHLSQKRAEAVVGYLVDKGIPAHQLKAVGYGENKPILKNSTEENREFNRRVEFRVL